VYLTPVLADTVERIPAPDKVSPGFAGFMLMFLLACATVLLIRSMVKHLRTVRYSPEPQELAEHSTRSTQSTPGSGSD
jgi:hypothetical protein